MTFPTVQGRNQGAASANVTTYPIPLPASIADGELLLAFLAKDGTGVETWGSGIAGWNVLVAGADTGTASCRGAILYKIAGQGESGNLSITGPSENWAGHSWRFTGYDPNLPPAFVSAGDGGTGSTNPNPAALNPTDWDTEDTYWLALVAGDGNVTATAAPASYGNFNSQLSTSATTTDRVCAARAERTVNGASEDPGTFTRGSEDWLAYTIGIRPTPAAPEQPILRSGGFYSASGASPTNSFTLDAGSNRRVFVSVAMESGTVSSMTYGGVSMSLVTDGTDTATSTNTARVEWWELLEADLPSNGSNSLVVNLSGSVECYINFIVVSNTSQSANVVDVNNANTGAATTVTTNVTVGVTGSLILSCCNKNTSPHFTNFTVGGVRAMGRGSCVLPTGGAFVMNVAREVTATGSTAVTSTCESIRQVMSTILLEPAPTDVNITGAISSSSPTATGTITAASSGTDPFAFEAIDTGGNNNGVEILSGTTLLVVGVSRNDAVGAGEGCTFGGVALDVIDNANEWVQLYYMLDPPEGIADIVAGGTNIASTIGAQYSGDGISFVSGTSSSALSQSFSPSDDALMVFVMSSGGTATPLTDTTERFDNGGDYYADRIEAGGGTFSVGCSAGSDPDSAAGLFTQSFATDVDVTGAVSSSRPSAGGSISTPKNVTGAVTSSSPSATGAVQVTVNITGAISSSSPSASGSVQAAINITGAVTSSSPTASGSVSTPKNVTGAISSSSPSATGSLRLDVNVTGAVTSSSPSATGSVSVVDERNVTGAVTSSSPSATGSVETPKNVTGAVSSSAPSASGALRLDVNVTGAIASSGPSASGALQLPKNVSGAVSSSVPSATGSIQASVNITGAVASSAPLASGTVVSDNTVSITGAVTSSSPSALGSVQVEVNITGAISSSSPSAFGQIFGTIFISGAVSSSSPSASGTVVLGDVPTGETAVVIGEDNSEAQLQAQEGGVVLAEQIGVTVTIVVGTTSVRIGNA